MPLHNEPQTNYPRRPIGPSNRDRSRVWVWLILCIACIAIALSSTGSNAIKNASLLGMFIFGAIGAFQLARALIFPTRPDEREFVKELKDFAETPLQRGDKLLSLTVQSADHDSLLLQRDVPLHLNKGVRIAGLIVAVVTIVLIATLAPGQAKWSIVLLTAMFVFYLLSSFVHRIAISPTAADGLPGIVIEKCELIYRRKYIAIPFNRLTTVEITERPDRRSQSINVTISGADRQFAEIAYGRLNERNRRAAWQLRTAILRMRAQSQGDLPDSQGNKPHSTPTRSTRRR